MKKPTILLLALSFILPIFGDNIPLTTPEKFIPTNPVTSPDERPQYMSWYEIYCAVNWTQATVYSPTSVCGEIMAIDTMTGATLCNVTTDLGGGYTFSIIPSHPMEIYVTIDGISYWCEI